MRLYDENLASIQSFATSKALCCQDYCNVYIKKYSYGFFYALRFGNKLVREKISKMKRKWRENETNKKSLAYIIMIHEMNAWPLNPSNQPASQRTSVTLECVAAAADASTEVAVDACYYYWLLNGNCCALRSTTSLLAPNTHRKWERTSTRYLVHGTHANHVKTHDSFLMC